MRDYTTYIANSKNLQLQIVDNDLVVIHKNSTIKNTYTFDKETMWNYINNLGFTKEDFTKVPF